MIEMQTKNATSPLLVSKDVAAMLGVSQATLSRWRTMGGGPAWLDLGGNIRYAIADVEAYIADNRKERR